MLKFLAECKRHIEVRIMNKAVNMSYGTDCDHEANLEESQAAEPVPELKLDNDLTPPELLGRVRQAVGDQPSLLEREFIQARHQCTATNGHGSSGNRVFRVMTWNWLAQSLSSGKDNFVRCPSDALKWEVRRLRLLEEILRVDPDVLCLQEVDHYMFIAPVLRRIGYEGSFFPKPDSPCSYTPDSNGPDGCAMFYRTSKFDAAARECFSLRTDSRDLLTNQVCVMYTLLLKSNPKLGVTIATTHLKAKKGWSELRLDQGKYLLNRLQKTVGKQPLIVCGDFNAEPSEPIYEVCSSSELDLRSAYTSLEKPFDEEPLYTTWKFRGEWQGGETEACHTIDYMWYTQSTLGVQALLSIPTEEQLGPDRLPSFRYPSDHLSLASDFFFL